MGWLSGQHRGGTIIEIIEPCLECGETDTLDPSMRICFECWCVLDIKEQEKQEEEE